ncbi:hypothetical protein [Peptostreptococcus stomatis]|uniref:hypothetical protein n=1 Tax=Peptostreptococcus stomatis TaxID=341694 RepID=UPI0028EBF778|nr:hypothetical protein [Peptostreptococcus stomatis]
MINATIKKYVSRYVVPFYFEYENDGYTRLVKYFLNDERDYRALGLPKDCKWVKRGFWENYRSDEVRQPEMDIYTYLLEVFNDEEDTNLNNLGTSFVLKTNGSLFNLQYVNLEESDDISFKCNDLGVILFRNGIGFIWYDIKFGTNISIEEYVNFQHYFKELARTHSEMFRKKIEKGKYEVFCMGKWIANIINSHELKIKFWDERKTKLYNTKQEICIPDKSLLFQYLFIDTIEELERIDLAFRIANGYDTKYNSPSNLKNKIYEPFGNTCFFTTKAGTSYVVSNNESNEIFFKENFKGKYIRDYFFIYVLLLYQTYSCAHYSRLLTKLPAEIKDIENNEKHIGKINDLHSQINLFLVKSTYESTSNIQHQNSAYVYGKNSLRIKEDMKSITVGLDALHVIELERQKAEDYVITNRKDRAINIVLVIFGFLAVFSVTIDALNLVDWFNSHNLVWGHWVSLGIIIVLTVFMFIVLIVNTSRKK